ncbi:MAG: hypothetical protein RLZZ228_882 [Actinomycetota bacterium]
MASNSTEHASNAGARRARWAVTGGIGLAAALGMSAFILLPAGATPSDKVTICHATSSTSNPYTVNNINTSSVDEAGNKYLNGHGNHTGPVYSEGMSSGWGDIIPPFSKPDSGTDFPGYNWDGAGQAIWDAGCQPPNPSPSPTPTETSPSPTPTETSPSPTPTETSPSPTPTETSPSPTPTETSPSPTPTETSPSPTPTSITTSPAPVTTSPAPVTTSPAPVTTSPAPVTTSPAPVTTSPAPVTTSPAPVTTSPAPVITTNPNPPTGGYPQSVPAGGGPGDLTGQGAPKSGWLWLAVLSFLALSAASFRQLIWGRDER